MKLSEKVSEVGWVYRIVDCVDERRGWRQFHMGLFRAAHHYRVVFYAQLGARSPERVRHLCLT